MPSTASTSEIDRKMKILNIKNNIVFQDDDPTLSEMDFPTKISDI